MFIETRQHGHISYLFCKGNKKVGLTEIKYICQNVVTFAKQENIVLFDF